LVVVFPHKGGKRWLVQFDGQSRDLRIAWKQALPGWSKRKARTWNLRKAIDDEAVSALEHEAIWLEWQFQSPLFLKYSL
jgi:hypothetical protein